ncbi:MAG: hypothetical protein IJY85_00030 [Ruminococcus sp.]|nr:hypothetical protein [Ruminococcus sp.]
MMEIGAIALLAAFFAPSIAALIWFVVSLVRRVTYRGDDTAARKYLQFKLILTSCVLLLVVGFTLLIYLWPKEEHDCSNHTYVDSVETQQYI